MQQPATQDAPAHQREQARRLERFETVCVALIRAGHVEAAGEVQCLLQEVLHAERDAALRSVGHVLTQQGQPDVWRTVYQADLAACDAAWEYQDGDEMRLLAGLPPRGI